MTLLIHTGGTIGMVAGPEGLVPGDGVVEAYVSAHWADLQRSGGAVGGPPLPAGDQPPAPGQMQHSQAALRQAVPSQVAPLQTAPMQAASGQSAPRQTTSGQSVLAAKSADASLSAAKARVAHSPHAPQNAQQDVPQDAPPQIRVVAFQPLLDSADLTPAHWNQLLALIEAEAGPVIITHGTDTLAYTGAALSLALRGWPHQVVLTGAMHPLGQGGDAEANLDLALTARPGPGVWLAFAGRILPAGHLAKMDSHRADAFADLAQGMAPQHAMARASLPRFSSAVGGIVTAAPGLTPQALRAVLAPFDVAVLRVFGAGTFPSSPAYTDVLREAVVRGLRIRAVSACLTGGISPGTYAAGAGLWAAGVENGGTQTPEAALAQLLLPQEWFY